MSYKQKLLEALEYVWQNASSIESEQLIKLSETIVEDIDNSLTSKGTAQKLLKFKTFSIKVYRIEPETKTQRNLELMRKRIKLFKL